MTLLRDGRRARWRRGHKHSFDQLAPVIVASPVGTGAQAVATPADAEAEGDLPFPPLRANVDYVIHDTNPPWRLHRPRWLSSTRAPRQPAYRLPRLMALRVVYTSVRGGRRDVQRDVRALVARMDPPPVIRGIEHLPESGRCVIVPNHYERPDGAWVGWGAIVIAAALARHRPRLAPVRWVMTSTWQDCYLGPLRVPPAYLTWVLRRFAVLYGLILMPALEGETFGRGLALRTLFHVLDDPSGQVVALHPEAGGFESLIAPPRGMGRVLGAIDRRQIPLIPTGVFEEAGRLTVCFGTPLPAGQLSRMDDTTAAQTVMLDIARLLPPANRGVYAKCVQTEQPEERSEMGGAGYQPNAVK